MGEKFEPWSICTDDEKVVYVADYNQDMIHLLSVEDCSAITSIDHCAIISPFTVRFHGLYLHIRVFHDKEI